MQVIIKNCNENILFEKFLKFLYTFVGLSILFFNIQKCTYDITKFKIF